MGDTIKTGSISMPMPRQWQTMLTCFICTKLIVVYKIMEIYLKTVMDFKLYEIHNTN